MKIYKLSFAILFFLGLSNVKAQEAIPATGGDASGNNGSVSYTIGQIAYTTNVGTNGNFVAGGVQQPCEIQVIASIPEAKNISLNISAYPNPTTSYITVNVENYETTNLEYLIFDTNGKLLQTVKATGQETKINTNNLIPANYFLKVLDNKKEIKVFKIIKN